MKILWICGSHILGGAERVTIQLLDLLRARGHETTVLCPAGTPLARELAGRGIAMAPAPLGGSFNLRAWRAVVSALRSGASAVALVNTPDEWVWACLARRRAPRLVLVRHMALRLPWAVRKLAGRSADAIVAVSNAVRESLVADGVIRPAAVQVIYNPVRFEPRAAPPGADERRAARIALGLPASGHWIGFFGGLDPNKGIGHVLAALAAANQDIGDETSLLVCGRGGAADERAFAETRHAASLDGRVHYLGVIDRMREAITAVDAVAIATHSSLAEGLPLAALEAMACGTPVAGYRTGGVSEALGEDDSAGCIVAADDQGALARALIGLLRDQGRANRLALGALARARRMFDPAQAADRYERLFAELTGARGRPPG